MYYFKSCRFVKWWLSYIYSYIYCFRNRQIKSKLEQRYDNLIFEKSMRCNEREILYCGDAKMGDLVQSILSNSSSAEDSGSEIGGNPPYMTSLLYSTNMRDLPTSISEIDPSIRINSRHSSHANISAMTGQNHENQLCEQRMCMQNCQAIMYWALWLPWLPECCRHRIWCRCKWGQCCYKWCGITPNDISIRVKLCEVFYSCQVQSFYWRLGDDNKYPFCNNLYFYCYLEQEITYVHILVGDDYRFIYTFGFT